MSELKKARARIIELERELAHQIEQNEIKGWALRAIIAQTNGATIEALPAHLGEVGMVNVTSLGGEA